MDIFVGTGPIAGTVGHATIARIREQVYSLGMIVNVGENLASFKKFSNSFRLTPL
jgi:hypothetical protein